LNILFDTNVILDVLQNRGEFAVDAAALFERVERAEINGFICANSISTIAYLLQRAQNRDFATKHIALLLKIFTLAPVTQLTIQHALDSPFKDFEEAIVHASALHVNVDGIVTRNPKDFQQAKLPIYTPRTLQYVFTQ